MLTLKIGMKQKPLNFLWISLEDSSPRLGCYGDRLAQTPQMDRLASEGMLFQNAFCTSPVCSPSRTAVITGFHATEMGAHHMRTTFSSEEDPGLPTPYRAVPPPFVKCITEALRAEGYYCSNNGKTDYQFRAPVSAWDSNGKSLTLDQFHWRNRPNPDQPFFAVFNLEDTHESRMWPDNGPKLEEDARPNPRTDPAAVAVPPFLPDTLAVRQVIARQYDNLAHNDLLVGKLLAQLEEDGLAENTVVMLWADHGEGLPRAKRFVYDSGLRVPLIIRWPGLIPSGAVERRVVSLIDLAPTVFSAAKLSIPLHFAGKNLLAKEPPLSPYIFAHRDRLDGEYGKSRCVRSNRFKYIRNYFSGSEQFGVMPYRSKHEAMMAIRAEQLNGNDAFAPTYLPEELYDLQEDPFEMHNLISNSEHAKILVTLREALDHWQDRHDPDLNVSEIEIASRAWPNGKEPITADPIAVVYGTGFLEGVRVADSGEYSGPLLLQFSCSSEGASIEYRLNDSPSWVPYRKAIRLESGTYKINFQAERCGYAVSQPCLLTLTIR